MQRDMEFIRKILFTIEDKFVDTWLGSSQMSIDGYDMKTIGYHCAILHDAGLLAHYKTQYRNNELLQFGVGRLTWERHELLDKIKSDTVYSKTKDIIAKKGISFVVDTVKSISTAVVTKMI